KPAVPPSEGELAAILAAIRDDPHRALWLTILGLGLRRGEALALRWSMIDLGAATVTIAKQYVRVRDQGGRGRLVEVDTKTPESKATLVMPDTLVDVLRQHRADQLRTRMAARVWVDPDLVFTT